VSKDFAVPHSAGLGRWLAGRVADVWYLCVKTALWAICKVLFRLRIEGRGHEPARGPFIVAANHASAIDPPIVGMSLKHKAAYMAKHELLRAPVLGALLRSIGVFPVRRGEPVRPSAGPWRYWNQAGCW